MLSRLRYLGIVLLTLSFNACTQQPRNISIWTNPDKHLIKELSGRRLVMVADYGHELPAPYQNLASAISNWLMMVESGESHDRCLTLFLEADDSTAKLAKLYVQTGNMDPFLDYMLPSSSLERLEFYSDLRRLSHRIDSLNQTLPDSCKIIFDIQGPEASNIFDDVISKASRRESSLYFVNTRDSLSAMNILRYLDTYPKQKGIVFYGFTHLIKNRVVKDVGGELSSEESRGCYVAFYLKRALGDRNVLSVNQVILPPTKINTQGFERLRYESGFVRSEDIPWSDLQPQDYDAFICRSEVYCSDHAFSDIFCTRIITASIKRMKILAPSLPGALASRYYHQALEGLKRTTGKDSMSIGQWTHWVETSRYDGLSRLRSMTFKSEFETYCRQSLGTRSQRINLMRFGIPVDVANRREVTYDEWPEIIDQSMPQIIFLNAIGIYWIGSPKEKASALNYLVEFSGERFDEPGKYLKWWRQKFHNASY
jgi:hypothetical protein